MFCYLVNINSYAEYIMRNAGLEEAQAGIKIAGRNVNNHISSIYFMQGFVDKTL